MKTTVKVRGKVDVAHVKKRYQAGRDKSLEKVGVFTRQAAKKQLGSNGPLKVKSQPSWRKVGEKDGVPVVSATFRPPRPGKVTSWATRRNPGGFLRAAIIYERDDRRGSVVIGPASRAVWLNRIQEFGGSRPVNFMLLNRRPISRLRNGLTVPPNLTSGGRAGRRDARGRFLASGGGEAYVVTMTDAQFGRKSKSPVFKSVAGRVKQGRYMANGLAKVRPRIPKAFQNFVSGP